MKYDVHVNSQKMEYVGNKNWQPKRDLCIVLASFQDHISNHILTECQQQIWIKTTWWFIL